MKKTEKINRSRYTLKEILSTEWDTSVIADYSDAEIEKIYFGSNGFETYGLRFNCNIFLNHKNIPNHRLLVLYINFKDNDKPVSKLNDKVRDKIKSLYDENYLNPCDSIMLIIDEPVSESIEKYINTLNIELHNDLILHGLTKEIEDDMKKANFTLGEELTLKHFKNVFCLNINSITNNLLKHSLIPKHEVIRDKKTITDILNKCNCSINQLPVILHTDVISKINRISSGDVVRITRKSIKCGEYPFYRVCK